MYVCMFPLCLNLRYNKCLFIFASRLGHKTVRDNEVPQLTIQTKYNEVSKIFFYISGFRWRVGDINSNKLLNLAGI